MPDHSLTIDDQRSLRCLVGMIIPASEHFQVPGADDDRIFADILRSFGPDADQVALAMRHLQELSGGVFADLPIEKQQTVAGTLREAGGMPLTMLIRIVIQCYYRDDRVMRSLGMEPRPPFPQGFTIEQGDWSLLDPVRARPKLYRPVP